jgi:hypothetical protein
VLIKVDNKWQPMPGGYKPYYPPPAGAIMCPVVHLHEMRRNGEIQKNYYQEHLEAFYVLRDALAPFMQMDWDTWHDWYNFKLRDNPAELAEMFRNYANSLAISGNPK